MRGRGFEESISANSASPKDIYYPYGRIPEFTPDGSPLSIEGSGTRTDPYLLDTKSDFHYFSENIEEGAYYQQTANIDITGFTGIGNVDNIHYFGGRYALSGLVGSLFGRLRDSTVVGVRIINAYIGDTGGVAAVLNNSLLLSCSISGFVVCDVDSTIVGTASNHTLYAKWTAKNPAYQDASGKWYVEMGYFPQTKVTNTTLKNNIKNSGTATGATYSIAGQTLTEYKYGNVKYALYNGEYYKVEPVRYVLQSSSSLKDGYATESGNVTAVSEKVLFASVWNEEELGLGSGYLDSDLRTNFTAFRAESGMVEDYTQTKSFQLKNFKNANGSGGSSTYSLARGVSSESEIQSVFGDLSAEFSDLVADILGGYLFYWTRDVGSNLNNAQTISAGGITGTQMKMQEILGVRITVNIKTLACEGS